MAQEKENQVGNGGEDRHSAPLDGAFDYGNAIKISADSIEQLRRVDVYRVLDSMLSENRLHGMADYIWENRPDLHAEVSGLLAEICHERGYPLRGT